MSERRRSNGHASETAHHAHDAPYNRQFGILSIVVLLSGLFFVGVLSLWLPGDLEPKDIWIGPLLAVGFLATEHLTINLDVRKVGWTITFTEIPLVLGLLAAPFEVVLAAHLVAGVGAFLNRNAAKSTAYNIGITCWETSTAFAVAYPVQLALRASAPAWVGAVAGTTVAPVISAFIGLMAVQVLGSSIKVGNSLRLVGRTAVVGVVNSCIGLIGWEVVRGTVWGWALVAVVSVGLAAMYWAYSELFREQRDLEALSDLSLSVARSGQHFAAAAASGQAADLEPTFDTGEWQSITERIREQLNARRVVLYLKPEPPAELCTLMAGPEIPEGQVNPSDDPMLQLPGTAVRYFRLLDAADDVRGALANRGAHEALVVPLRGASQLLGAIEAHDRLSRWRGFGQADVRLLRTLSAQLATAIDNRRLLGRLRHDAYHDPLTGLLNRAGFQQAAAEHVAGATESVVLRIDLEVLSTVSDALGHEWADRMVVVAGERLRDVLGGTVPLARLESGIFAALLTGCDQARAQRVAERVRAELSRPYTVDKVDVEANAVIGYVPSSVGETREVDTLLQCADVAVRAARTSGEAVRAYVPAMGQIFLRRFQLVTQFRQALDTDQVRVHYQPKVALPGREVVGVEALVRWQHPEFGHVEPDEFVPAVEATGLVDVLTAFVLERSLIKIRKWLDNGFRLSVAVNLSVRNLSNENFPDLVAEALVRNNVPPSLLTFELTESGVMADPAKALPVLRRLHTLGVVLAVDDFGTGYSSLAYLRQLPVDEVKIDKSFVLGMGTDLGDMAVVRSIVELGHSLGLAVVAEGVEEDVAREQLIEMGCDVAQGYLISRPLSEERLEAWLQARTMRSRGKLDETILTLMH